MLHKFSIDSSSRIVKAKAVRPMRRPPTAHDITAPFHASERGIAAVTMPVTKVRTRSALRNAGSRSLYSSISCGVASSPTTVATTSG
eukprot:4986638-Prymnesium_polylepis.2